MVATHQPSTEPALMEMLVSRLSVPLLRVRFHIIRNARIENVGKSQSCIVSKLRIIRKQTVGHHYRICTSTHLALQDVEVGKAVEHIQGILSRLQTRACMLHGIIKSHNM